MALVSSAYRGFVVAMRARIAAAAASPRLEWIIVSRWGASGENLSIGLTGVDAGDERAAPVTLMPRQTALAVAESQPAATLPMTFTLAASLPEGARVAGEFLPAEGYVVLYGDRALPRIRSEARCLKTGAEDRCQLEAARAPWIGEFIEPGA